MRILTKLNGIRVGSLYALRQLFGRTRHIEVSGCKFEVSPKFSLDSALIRLGEFESDLIMAIQIVKLIGGSTAYVDIGANAGYWAIPLAKTFPVAFAFEPDNLIRERLRRNASLNGLGNLSVSEFAVSDASGRAGFAVRRALDNSGALNDGLGSLLKFDSNLESILEVTTVTLDDFFQSQDLVAGLIKIDVEGAEDMVLSGGKNVLNNHRPVVVSELLFSENIAKSTVLDSRFAHFPKGYLHFEVLSSRLSKLQGVSADHLSDLNVFSIPEEHLEKLTPLLV